MVDSSEPSDRTLVLAALAASNSYGAIVARYEFVLRRYVKRLLGSHAQAVDDVLQETFLKAYLNLNDYDQARSFSPWLYRIAHNEAISFLRRLRAQPQAIGGEDGRQLLERIVGGELNGKRVSGRSEDKIQAALQALDPQYRDALVLRYLEERSYDDIADILELPMGTVATRIRRGLQRLRSSLLAAGEDFGEHVFHE